MENAIVAASPNISYLPVAKPLAFTNIRRNTKTTFQSQNHRTAKAVFVCEPKYFDVIHLGQNPYMTGKNKVNKKKAQEQWLNLIIAIGNCGIPVHFQKPEKGLYDQCFTANHAFCFGLKAMVAKFAAPAREPETQIAARFLQELDYSITLVPETYEIDLKPCWGEGRNTFFFGYGPRSSRHALPHVQKFLGSEATIIPLELVDNYFYHLDLTLTVLPREYFIVYTAAFSPSSKTRLLDWFVANGIDVQERVYFLADDEARAFMANSVCLAGNHILTHRYSNQLKGWISARGFEVHEIDVSEFHKSGGSVACLVGQMF